MRATSHPAWQHGQAAVEALFALTLLTAFMHGVVTVGAIWLRGQQAMQSGRVALFANAKGWSEASGDRHILVSVEPLPVSTPAERLAAYRDAPEVPFRGDDRYRSNSSAQTPAGRAHAETLARDWLGVRAGLHQAQAIAYAVDTVTSKQPAPSSIASPRTPAFASPTSPASILSVHRHMVMAIDTGHLADDAAVPARIQHSAVGWKNVAQPSLAIAEKIKRRAERSEALWERGAWPTDWLSHGMTVRSGKADAVSHGNQAGH